jgi:hypothetical protein
MRKKLTFKEECEIRNIVNEYENKVRGMYI